MSGWSDQQVAVFAKRFAESTEGRAWWAFVDDVREALIDQAVLHVVLAGDDDRSANLGDIRSLRTRLARRLQSRHGLRNQAGGECKCDLRATDGQHVRSCPLRGAS